jgi:ribosomal protein S6E (S10)
MVTGVDTVQVYYLLYKFIHLHIQGGSDKSGIFFFFLLNGTAQLKIIRFY